MSRYDVLGRLQTITVKELNGQVLSTPLVTTDAYNADGNKAYESLPGTEKVTSIIVALRRQRC